ncbi:MFS transporter [Protaetiibacter sp. SSC-01]|nr:MFS transporter [Protaetiibacter sp. SSC-01]
MGIGLVDPILPSIAEDLEATPTETELLFTSYLLVTGIMMFFTSWVSSRIGARRTLLIGLTLIVAFAAAAGLSGSVDGIIGFRAGWGLGNALFVSTALATIVGAAAGGSGPAIILYEAALGVGLAIGPLLGGLLGNISWRGPFFGTAALMAIALVAITVMLPKDADAAQRPAPAKLSAPFRALRIPALAVLALVALFYNIGFFILLAYTPFPLGFDAIGLGLTFTAWGLSLAVTSVWVAPLLTARMRRTTVLATALPLLAVDLVLAGVFVESPAALVGFVVIGGLLLGVVNTVLTEAVMEATELPRGVASSSYSGVRFLGAAAAPPLATELASIGSSGLPYYVGGLSVAIAIVLVLAFRGKLSRVDDGPEPAAVEAEAIGIGDAA